jgi:hypothetical protein
LALTLFVDRNIYFRGDNIDASMRSVSTPAATRSVTPKRYCILYFSAHPKRGSKAQ